MKSFEILVEIDGTKVQTSIEKDGAEIGNAQVREFITNAVRIFGNTLSRNLERAERGEVSLEEARREESARQVGIINDVMDLLLLMDVDEKDDDLLLDALRRLRNLKEDLL